MGARGRAGVFRMMIVEIKYNGSVKMSSGKLAKKPTAMASERVLALREYV